MDINSLLSPQDSQAAPPPSKRPNSLRKNSLLSQAATAAPPAKPLSSPATPTSSNYPLAKSQSPSITPLHSPHAQWTQSSPGDVPPRSAPRHSSASMDTLADLASMQQYQSSTQTPRQNQPALRNSELPHQTNSPKVRNRAESLTGGANWSTPGTPTLQRNDSVVSIVEDIAMGDAPAAVVQPRNFVASSLSSEDLRTISDLTKQLNDSPWNYDSHAKLIKLLHRGFLSHILPPDDPETFKSPHDYPLLQDLRQARDAMDARFQVGEDIWLEWLQAECMLAQSIEERVGVMELCKKAVHEEVGSAQIWRLYGDWVWWLYKNSHGIDGIYEECSLQTNLILVRVLEEQKWNEEDKLVGQELFKWDTVMDIWQEGVRATRWHIDSSHTVWDPYMELQIYELSIGKSNEKRQQVWGLFKDRLRQPHLTWDDTFQAFSQFLSREGQDNESWEQTMVETKNKTQKVVNERDLRQEWEQRLQRARQMQDREAEWNIWTEYLDWESGQHKKNNAPYFARDMFIGLCERANLRFPTEVEFWETHLELLMELPKGGETMLTAAERATRHCAWSGELWAKRLYTMESSKKPFEELEGVKHYATSTGLLEEIGGLDELIKVYMAWCSILRHRAFGPNATEDERDIAEVAIRSAIENVENIGVKRFGKDFKGDPRFRIERIYLKFLAQTGAFDEARKIWQKLMLVHGDSYEFWTLQYLFEMSTWGIERGAQAVRGGAAPLPEHATAVLQRAIRRPNLDWPEKMIEMYVSHCAQHETVDKLLEAQVEARRVSKQVNKRRAKEMANAPALQAQTQQAYGEPSASTEPEKQSKSSKRKRGDDAKEEKDSSKRARSNEDVPAGEAHGGNASSSATSQLKRDREHTTIIVKHLPPAVDEAAVKKFFRDCGNILSISIVPNNDESEATATIEFETKEDVLTAQTQAKKPFDGHSIDIQAGTETTLWVTNYPPEADERYLRNLFKPYGEIIEVRFPSLKFDTHRRFCYMQFLTASQAHSASSALDGKALGGNRILTARISDPSAKKERQGAMQEGREVFVGNVERKAREQELKSFLEESGFENVESVRIPRDMAGRGKGSAFLIFPSKEVAESAVGKLNLKEFRGRILNVSMAVPNAKGTGKRQATTIVGAAGSPASAASPGVSPGAAGSPESNPSVEHQPNAPPSERTIALMNIPDTVNDARVRALVEAHAPLRKLILKPDHGGAIVELEKAADVGLLGMKLEGTEIEKGAKIKVGTVPELLKRGKDYGRGGGKEEKKGDDRQAGGKKPEGGGGMQMFASSYGMGRRPGTGAPKRGGLGFKRGGGGGGGNRVGRGANANSAGDHADFMDVDASKDQKGSLGQTDSKAADAGNKGQGKSQDDFRALMAGGGGKGK